MYRNVILQFVDLFVLVFNFLLLIRIVLSWVAPQSDNAFSRLVFELTEPILAPIRKLVGGGMLDFSPLIAFFLLQGLQRLVYYLVQ